MTSRITYRFIYIFIYRYTVCYYRYRDNNVIIVIIKLSILSHSPNRKARNFRGLLILVVFVVAGKSTKAKYLQPIL